MALAHPADNPSPPASRLVVGALGVLTLGAAVAWMPQLGFLAIAIAGVVLAVRYVEVLCVATFWTLPYMVVNLPTGAFTLKLPELFAYLLAAAVPARALLRRERLALPPATLPVLIYLAVGALSIACSPAVPLPYVGDVPPYDRSSPNLKGITMLIWLGLSWMVVVAVYHVAGGRPALYWRCLRAHILGGGLASVISITLYGLALGGMQIQNTGGLGITRNLVPKAGDVFRLAGVAYEPLMLALYLLSVIPVTLVALLMYPEWIPRWLSATCLVFQVTAMILSFSTGGWVALIVVLLLMIPLYRRARMTRRQRTGLLAGALAFVALAGAVFFVQSTYLEKIFQTFSKAGGGDPVRQGEWQAGIGMTLTYPMLGVGLGQSGFHFPRYHPTLQSQILGGTAEINNIYLNTTAETGFVGLGALAWCAIAGLAALMGVILRHGMANVPALTALTASLIGAAIQYNGMMGLMIIYFPGLLAIATAGYRVARMGPENPPAWRLSFWR